MEKLKVPEHGERPLIAVPVTGKTEDEIIAAFSRVEKLDADIIEWRADLFSELDKSEKVKAILSHAPENLLFTVRTKEEGGEFSGSDDDYFEILHFAAAEPKVRLLDIEYLRLLLHFADPSEEVQRLKCNGILSVISHHDFNETPSSVEMLITLKRMHKLNADFVKLAVMPHDEDDVIRLLSVTRRFKKENPDVNLITMAMGRLGLISRISGQLTGSCLTFASEKDGLSSAPGQLSIKDMKNVLSLIEGEDA